jgi:hypothetical protein
LRIIRKDTGDTLDCALPGPEAKDVSARADKRNKAVVFMREVFGFI